MLSTLLNLASLPQVETRIIALFIWWIMVVSQVLCDVNGSRLAIIFLYQVLNHWLTSSIYYAISVLFLYHVRAHIRTTRLWKFLVFETFEIFGGCTVLCTFWMLSSIRKNLDIHTLNCQRCMFFLERWLVVDDLLSLLLISCWCGGSCRHTVHGKGRG